MSWTIFKKTTPSLGDTQQSLNVKTASPERPQYSVFISYRRDGGYFPALYIHEKLNSNDCPAFMDMEDLYGGDKWKDKINYIIENTPASYLSVLLVCLTVIKT